MRKPFRFSTLAAALTLGVLAGTLLATITPLVAQGPEYPPPQPPGPGGMVPGGPMPPGAMPMPGGPMRMGPAAIVANENYVYVLRGNTLYQFSAKDLKLLNKAILEEEIRPFPEGPGRPQRPMGPGGPSSERSQTTPRSSG